MTNKSMTAGKTNLTFLLLGRVYNSPYMNLPQDILQVYSE